MSAGVWIVCEASVCYAARVMLSRASRSPTLIFPRCALSLAPGTDRERPYLIDKIKHKHPKLTSAGRVIRVRVIPNGPTRVVLIRDEGDTNADLAHLDPAVIAMADDTTISDGMTGTGE